MDSAGKTITALLIGVLVKQHALSLDTPLKALNVTTESKWGHADHCRSGGRVLAAGHDSPYSRPDERDRKVSARH